MCIRDSPAAVDLLLKNDSPVAVEPPIDNTRPLEIVLPVCTGKAVLHAVHGGVARTVLIADGLHLAVKGHGAEDRIILVQNREDVYKRQDLSRSPRSLSHCWISNLINRPPWGRHPTAAGLFPVPSLRRRGTPASILHIMGKEVVSYELLSRLQRLYSRRGALSKLWLQLWLRLRLYAPRPSLPDRSGLPHSRPNRRDRPPGTHGPHGSYGLSGPPGSCRPHRHPGSHLSLIHIYGQPLLRYCHHILCDYHEAQDAVQATFIKAWSHRAGFRGGSLQAWLFRMAYTTSICLLYTSRCV